MTKKRTMTKAKITDADREALARMKEIRELLAEFGLVLRGYMPGVSADRKNGNRNSRGYFGEQIVFEHGEWTWLEPLLIELREPRKKEQRR